MRSAMESLHDVDLVKSADEFVKAINKSDNERGKKSKVVKKKTFAPSGVGYGKGRCARFWYYAFEGVHWEDSSPYRNLRNMENGTDRHTRFEALMNSMGAKVLIENEEEILSDDPPVRGFIDSQVEWKGVRWIIEFKTKGSAQFKKLRATSTPPIYNLIQLLLYMHIKGYSYGMLVYENKDTHDMYAIPVKLEGRILEYKNVVVDWLNNVYSQVRGEDRKLPNRAFTEKSKECKYCPVKDFCWSDDREVEVEIERQPELRI
jgi:hypothetical protein